ncbi:MAG: hypothetical protein KH616_21970 [Burkholderia sp.]|nr:hypothetical protein [Burkholderia sp.]
MRNGRRGNRAPPILKRSHHTDGTVPKTASRDRPLDDPRPTPPPRPAPEDCCHSGCSPCVFDLYAEALGRYRVELAAWEARHAKRKKVD